ncbi:lysophospholipid acyltransferase family protein [Nocardioides ferulae]|uniref:lysophospholipid acyltransferase family protein n=1 Tax=Nocardioides ferulae TaxID=2340821 RepID=UPI001F0C0B80|nr:lysophospholipid acyltransferase family protein [Nocardioides ferulae]
MSPHRLPPRSDRVRHPWRVLLASPLRPLARFLIRLLVPVRVHGADLVPQSGPVIFAANHIGVADGPLLAIFAPGRPVHALTKAEMFRGFLGRFLRASGQIPIDRFHVDARAVRESLRVLRDGGAIGVFPEGRRDAGDLSRFHRGAAYFALVTGAPVVPVIILGTRRPGGHAGELPRRGSRVDLVFGAPITLEPQPWPRTKEQVGRASMLLREHMLVHLDHARTLTGQQLPGPLPSAEVEPDPATGVTEQGAP